MAIERLDHLKIENEIDGSMTHLFDVDGAMYGVVVTNGKKQLVDRDYLNSSDFPIDFFTVPDES